jgi:outer membrane protein insertion porin family
MTAAASMRQGRLELMGRTALLIERGRKPFPRYTAGRGGVKAARLARALGGLAFLVLVAGAAHAQDEAEKRTVFVNRILISGNDHVPGSELRARMRTREPSTFSIFRKPHLDLALLDRDVVQIEAFYHSIGFPDAKVSIEGIDYLEKGRFADVRIRVVEGEPIRVQSVVFDGNLILPEKDLREGLLLATGTPYNSALLGTDIYHIRGKYFDRGYLGVLIADSVRIEERRADIRFTIDPGRQLHVGAISIEGNELVRTGVVEAEIALEPGAVCRYDKVLETERNLFETGLFSVVDVIPERVDSVAATVDIRIRLRERKESWLEAGFGVGNVLGSRVFGEWGTRNLAGTGRTVRLKAQYAFDLFEGDDPDPDQIAVTNTYYRYDAIYQQRRVFGLKLPTGLNGYLEWDATVPNLEVSTVGAAISVMHEFGRLRDYGRENRATGTFAVEEIKREESDQPEERSRSHILGSSISKDTRDFVLNPSVGEYRVLAGEVAGGILGGDNDFYGFTGNYQRYHGVHTQSVLAWRVNAGYTAPYGRSDEVPVENRFFLGGSNSVRGYEESGLGPRNEDGNVAGGEVMLLANVEIRFPLPFFSRWNFSGAFFFDSGNVWESIDEIDASDFELNSGVDETEVDDYRYGTGLGIRYNTPVGPIRVDYGYPFKPDRHSSEDGTFYFSLGQIF